MKFKLLVFLLTIFLIACQDSHQLKTRIQQLKTELPYGMPLLKAKEYIHQYINKHKDPDFIYSGDQIWIDKEYCLSNLDETNTDHHFSGRSCILAIVGVECILSIALFFNIENTLVHREFKCLMPPTIPPW